MTIPTDGAGGVTKAIDVGGPQSFRIRCGFPKRQTFQPKVPARVWPEVKALRVDMRDAPSREKAEQRRDARIAQYQREFPALWRGLLDAAEASLTPLALPQRQQH